MYQMIIIIVLICIVHRLMQVPKPWYRSYVNAKASMEQDLFVTNPTMAAVLELWHKTFG